MILAYFQYEFYQRFGVEPMIGVIVIILGVFLPIVASIFFLYLAFSDSQYQGVNRYGI
jgi:vacuolar-type H+-ATPase subunit I/STV1